MKTLKDRHDLYLKCYYQLKCIYIYIYIYNIYIYNIYIYIYIYSLRKVQEVEFIILLIDRAKPTINKEDPMTKNKIKAYYVLRRE